jgi:hypothetical protein
MMPTHSREGRRMNRSTSWDIQERMTELRHDPPRLVLLGMLALAAVCLATTSAWAGGRVYDSPEAVEPLAPGASVPSVRVETVRGEPVDLAERMREQGALLVFYRGGW